HHDNAAVKVQQAVLRHLPNLFVRTRKSCVHNREHDSPHALRRQGPQARQTDPIVWTKQRCYGPDS
ncbi:MAG TPA: hypothetical protein VMS16_02895, partial [Mycobacterium sp.]|nr:hypothetical protein [Mycobacterium sp.]